MLLPLQEERTCQHNSEIVSIAREILEMLLPLQEERSCQHNSETDSTAREVQEAQKEAQEGNEPTTATPEAESTQREIEKREGKQTQKGGGKNKGVLEEREEEHEEKRKEDDQDITTRYYEDYEDFDEEQFGIWGRMRFC
ncbi:unnamed protein product [Calypogeia fissa]